MNPIYKLVGATVRYAGYEYGFGPGLHEVGRHSTNQITLPGESSVSRHHARIIVTSSAIAIEDCKSTNGTFVNGQRIKARTPLRQGDSLQFGDAVFVLKQAEENSPQGITALCPTAGCLGRIRPAHPCPVCGRLPVICMRCHAPHAAEARFCRFDGSPLSAPIASNHPVTGNVTLMPGTVSGLAPRSATLPPGKSKTTLSPVSAGPTAPTRTVSVPSHPATDETVSTETVAPAVVPPTPPHPEPSASVSLIGSPRVATPSPTVIPRCPVCKQNVGSKEELCPRCHSRVKRCRNGHISPAWASKCTNCGEDLVLPATRWGVFRGAASSGWTAEAVRPPLHLAWKYRPPEGPVRWTSPVIGNGQVFAASSDDCLYAIKDGVMLWRCPLDGPVRTERVPETGVPAFDEDRIILGHMGGSVIAVHALNGTPLWQTELHGQPTSPVRPAVGKLFIGIAKQDESGAVVALSREGEILWQTPTNGPVYSCPAFANGMVIVTTDAGSVIALEARTGDRVWQFSDLTDGFDTSAAVIRDSVYVTTRAGKMTSLGRMTGEVQISWTSPTGNAIHSSPAAGFGRTDGELFFGSDDGCLYVISATTGQLITSHSTNGAILGSPAVSDDLVYAASQDGTLYVCGPECHTIEPAYKMPDGIQIVTSPAIGDGRVFFAGSDGFLYALETWLVDTNCSNG